MDFNTKAVKEGVEQIATMFSNLVVGYAQEREGRTVQKIYPNGISSSTK